MTQVPIKNTLLAPPDAILKAEDAFSPATPTSPEGVDKLDIEHARVEDDPRRWSYARKTVVLIIISGASVIGGLGSNIQNPANSQIEQDLHATASQISLTMSLFGLLQGCVPLVWSAISEIKGRKLVYLLSIALFIVSSAIVAVSQSIGLVIGMRLVEGVGASAVLAIGAATLADIYEPHERGTLMGIYYTAPLLGPSIGPILGGLLAQGFNWRAIFWFLTIWGGIIFLAFLFLFKDTFRKERSLTYQNVLKKRTQEHMLTREKHATQGERPSNEKMTSEDGTSGTQTLPSDVEARPVIDPTLAIDEVKLSFVDINPFPPFLRTLSRKNNLIVLVASGLICSFTFSITYTCARTLSLYYDYDAMTIGLVLLSFGIGSLLGSVLGGRWSDKTLTRLKSANGGVSYPEMRLESTKLALLWFTPSVIGYAWVCQKHVHIAAVCVMLFLSGFWSMWIYASILTYIVDANVGRSSSAVATNSLSRGLFAFLAVEVAVPLQDAIGDGGLYTLLGGLTLLAQLMLLLVLWKGQQWREASIDAENQKSRS